MIYLDHNATSPLCPEALAAVEEALRDVTGNASSAHRAGARARDRVETARRRVADRIGAPPAAIVFTSGGTESNNLAILGAAGGRPRHALAAPLEHSSVIEPLRELERRGCRVTWLPVDGEGRIDPDELERAIEPETDLVVVGWANGEIGTVQHVAAIASVCRRRRTWLHVDAAQAVGRLEVSSAVADSLTISSHKVGGPQGVGALYVRDRHFLRPLCFGGPQERNLRPGTENVAAIAGFGAAVAAMDVSRMGAIADLRERLWRGLCDLPGIRRHTPTEGILPNTLNVGFQGLRGEVLVAALDLEGVCVSVGSACAAGSAEPSHVLLALGYDSEAARSALRFSLGPETTREEIDHAIEAVRRVVTRALGVTAPAAEVQA